MNISHFTEDALVQQTTAEYLEEQLGWESVYAYNNEDFGPEGLLGRHSDKEIVLTRYLHTKLVEFNPNLPDDVYNDAVRQVTSSVASQSLVATNRDKYKLIREGVPVSYRDEKGELKRQNLRIFDFEEPEKNHFLCVRELWVKGELYRRRADIVGFVNGLPLLFGECKNIYKDLQTAYEENYSDYLDTIPHLFHHNAIVMFNNGNEAKIGSITSRWEHFHAWKRLSEEDEGVVDMETLLKGVCDKTNFMDLVENFILFDDSAGEPKKILARNHQFLGVNRAIKAVRERKEREGKLGVFWHTQGAGKSYSMVIFSRKVHRKIGGNYTFLVLTDREDLDQQIYDTFTGCGAVHEGDDCRASDGEHLSGLLSQQKSYVFSLIHKFHKRVDQGEEYTNRDDVIVMSDEAHRTQYGKLALNMWNALPNASYIGFTGTPLFKDDEITRRVFGDYVSTYDFQRAVDDKATVPLYYDSRGKKLGIAVSDINERIAEKLEEFETDDIDVEQRLEKELKREYHIITAQKRLDQVARDFVKHYSTAWETGKAMLVCIDKITCVRMHNLVAHYWDKRITELESKVSKTKDEQEENFLKRQISWMKDTRSAVVVSEEQGEVDKFRKWDLDITPHRRLMKQGMDIPEKLRDKPGLKNKRSMKLDEAFKEDQHPFRIAIVCAMWLTGFDVPSLSTLYLDKPLKAHTLMQAIARANRVNEGKNNGLIVDYSGNIKNLRKALADFAGTQSNGEDSGSKEPAKPNKELLAELEEAINLTKLFLKERRVSLDEVIKSEGFDRNAAIIACKEAANENDESRKRFEVMCREVFKKFKACLNIRGINKYRSYHDALNIIYKSLQEDREKADISDIIRKLHRVVDQAIEVDAENPNENVKPYDISKIDFDLLKKEFEKSSEKKTTVQSLKQAVEEKIQTLLEQNPLRTDFQEHYEKIVAEYNKEKDRATIEKTFEDLLKMTRDLDEEEYRAYREGLSQETLAIFDLLKKDELSKSEISKVKTIAIKLLDELKAEKLKIDRWRDKESSRDAVRIKIYNYLWDDKTGLPENYSREEIEQKTDDVFHHIYRVYPTVPSPYYGQPGA